MTTYNFKQDLSEIQQRINAFMLAQFDDIQCYSSPLAKAMKYGLLLGGKRIRPFLVYATGRILGANLEQLDYAAAALECIHAYSLIHDDLPAMDNDDLRRGQPTCHIAFDHATAILAGDALQAFAFDILTKNTALSAEQKLALVQVLSRASGVQGMCLGQSLDLLAEHKQVSLNELETIHRNKTGALLSAAVTMGFICSPEFGNQKLAQHLDNYSNAIGLAFQVQDDILDIVGDQAEIGKPVGSDVDLDKSTYPKLLGLDGAKQKAQELYQTAVQNLQEIPFDTSALRSLAEFVVNRKN
ncbi:(2E,6E)-farnesyl diphosphate synthase [Lonepinella sp. BR2474]|uniref:(2E,6E)-farnesyl diphosphate synthase n=1 Tax=Lonepinella sp. BR2474 TaxID=3434548 RepID=UPI003F6DCCDD